VYHNKDIQITAISKEGTIVDKNQSGFLQGWLFLVLVAAVIALGGWWVSRSEAESPGKPCATIDGPANLKLEGCITIPDNEHLKKYKSFDECVAAGEPVLESYPEVCGGFYNPRQQLKPNL
jgi:hypothetical protein